MEYIKRLACSNNRRDTILNQELAKELAEEDNKKGIQEIASHLNDKDQLIQSNCIKVLYEIGYIKPRLISDYVLDYIKFLSGKNNRMIWGSMIALATIAEIQPKTIWNNIDLIIETMKKGTLITEVWGIKILATLCSIKDEYYHRLVNLLINYIKVCRPIDLSARIEVILPTLKNKDLRKALGIIEAKKNELTRTQLKKVSTITKRY